MKIITGIEQGTHEWLKLRQGKVTGTRLDDVMGTPAARLKLISELIAEEGTESVKVMRPTPEMERGSAEEAFAVKEFEKQTGKKVDKVTMLISDEFDWFGLSPDGMIKDSNNKFTEQIEVKSPNSATMIMYRMINCSEGSKKSFLGIPLDYKWQVVAAFIMNSDLQRMNFVVYDARFIESSAKMYHIVIEREHPSMLDAIATARASMIDFRSEWLAWKELVLPDNF